MFNLIRLINAFKWYEKSDFPLNSKFKIFKYSSTVNWYSENFNNNLIRILIDLAELISEPITWKYIS